MNKFESNNSENPNEGYEDLVKYHEDLEEQERAEEREEVGPHVEEFEEMITPLLEEEVLNVLNAIKTKEEALDSEERESAKEALISIVRKMKFIDQKTDISKEEYAGLFGKYKIFSNAVGFINNGIVDHDR